MIRKNAIKEIIKSIDDQLIISANGYISRDLFTVCDRNQNFYMIGSMGLSSSISLGIALKNPKKRVCVFDGDGNILMNLGSLVTIGSHKPKNLIHFIFDNHSHESTGGQPTNSKKVLISDIAKASNYNVFSTSTQSGLKKILQKIQRLDGPIMRHVKIQKGKGSGKRIDIEPKEIKNRFMAIL